MRGDAGRRNDRSTRGGKARAVRGGGVVPAGGSKGRVDGEGKGVSTGERRVASPGVGAPVAGAGSSHPGTGAVVGRVTMLRRVQTVGQ